MIETLHYSIVEKVTNQIYQDYPELQEKYGDRGREKCKEDNVHHMKHLETSFAMQNKEFFIDYSIWLNGILNRHGMDSSHLAYNYTILQKYIGEEFTEEKAKFFVECLSRANEVITGENP
ncbi:hypothetical protein GJU40_05060 [Bacillus lacus]|uniref:Uncharacterized protein n=1 Tax=Metabacillus lacus TaxID=1983721 RepID=A0A7X2IXR3_9BACI|nr:hypothetical protein [Metabacillus lacus]MRX71544.1 hypothetical protein [Metabacillus lacus]